MENAAASEVTEYMFSNLLLGAVFSVVLVCLMLPILYLIFYTVKKKIDLLTVVFGILGFLLFGYLLSGFVLGAVNAAAGETAPMTGALLRALCVAVVEGGGAFAALTLLRRREDGLTTPISYALGYPLITLFLYQGAESFMSLGTAYAVNSVGLEEFMSSVDPAQKEAMTAALQKLQATEPYVYFFSAVDCICIFVLFAAVCRILWYALHQEGRNRALLLALGLIFRFGAEIPTAFYQLGGTANYIACEIVRYVITALCVVAAVLLHLRYDEKKVVSAGPLDRRFPR